MTREEAIEEVKNYDNYPNGLSTECRNYILKALEQEPTTKNDLGVDCVRRSDIGLTDFEIVMCNGDYKEALKILLDKIEKAPSVTPQEPRWIPVSERLPNLDDYTDSKEWQKKVLITGYLSFDDTKELFVSEAFVDDVINHVHDTIIKAWMPLPEPYEPQESEVAK